MKTSGWKARGEGALIAKMSRAEFLDELFRAKVPACQVTVDELTSRPGSRGESAMHYPWRGPAVKSASIHRVRLW